MPTARRTVPCLVPLMAALTALLCAVTYLLGGFPTGRAKAVPDTDTPADAPLAEDESAPPIRCVVIDAGHGGEDGGASSASGVVEKEINLAVALALRDLFEAAGIPVVMTRTEDVLLYDRNVDFKGRKKVLDLAARRLVAERTAEAAAKDGGTSLFISIHMNAFPQPQYSGMQVWYGTDAAVSQEIAFAIQTASAALMPDNHRKIKAAGSNLYLLDSIKTPAVLVECGFLSNPEEALRLSDPRYRHALAVLIFSAAVPYVTP